MSQVCGVCQRPPERVNNEMAECSHVECPHRRRAWSERPEGGAGPGARYDEHVPAPLDGVLKRWDGVPDE